mgnify:CR=1 FL=1
MTTQTWTVSDVRVETPLIHRIGLVAPRGEALPPLASGAHLQVMVPGLPERRCYSIVHLTVAESLDPAPRTHWIAVRREEPSRGGSVWMHQLKAGDAVTVGEPRNEFPLHAAHAGDGPTVLIAGGVGITPIASHAAALTAQARPFALHYSSRSRDQLAMVDELQALCGDALHLHADDDAATRLDLAALLKTLKPSQHLYVCGPKGMIDAAIALATQQGWPKNHIHVELFVEAATLSGDQPFEVELRQSGKVLQVPANKTILEVMEEAGLDPMFDCRRGECGVCQATVLEGIPDHRDYVLSDEERASGKLIQICISRAKSPRLVLDL